MILGHTMPAICNKEAHSSYQVWVVNSSSQELISPFACIRANTLRHACSHDAGA
jgi:hypothetical protein